MRRRDFGKALVSGVIGAGLPGAAISQAAAPAHGTRTPRKNTLMHVGADYHGVAGGGVTSRENLEYNLRFGVKHISPDPGLELAERSERGGSRAGAANRGGVFMPADGPSGGAFDLDTLKRMRDDCDKMGVTIEAFRMDSGYIVMKPGPERDRKLEQAMENIRKTSQVGVGIITQHWTMIPIRRNGTMPGRGGSVYTTFKLEENWQALPVGIAGRISSEEYWERIATFLQKVIPVCAEYKVKFATHPYDPPGLPFGYEGVDNWDSPSVFTAIKRYEKVVDSPYNGFQLDLGVLIEGSTNPNQEIPPIVRYLAERGKIHQIHMRNIRGGLNNFAEVYPDEGDLDFFGIVRILRDAQYPGGILPDHIPAHPDDPGKLQGYAFGYGYIHGLINSANSEVA